jgi:hypothetical protein
MQTIETAGKCVLNSKWDLFIFSAGIEDILSV